MSAQKATAFKSDPFAPAIKRATKLKMGITAESGAGKTYTALLLANYIVAQIGGKVAVVNTEGSDLSLYADKFTFNEVTLRDNYDPAEYIAYIHAAADYGYSVLVIDSLTHAWNGTNGVLEIADKYKIKNNKLSGWIVARPAHNALVDAIVNTPVHLICTMRGKYAVDIDNPNAPKVMEAIQDKEMEFEFSISAHLDHSHQMTVAGKSRYEQLPTGYASKNYKEIAERLVHATSGVDIPAWVTREKVEYLLNSLAQNGIKEDDALNKIGASHRFDYVAWGQYDSGQAAWSVIMGAPVQVETTPETVESTIEDALEEAYEVLRVEFIRHAGKRRNDVLYRIVLDGTESLGLNAVFAYAEHIEAFGAAGYADVSKISDSEVKPLVMLREDAAGYRIVSVQKRGSSEWVDVKPKHAPEQVRVEIIKLQQSIINGNAFYIASLPGGKTFDIYPPVPRSKRADQVKILRDAGYGEWLTTGATEWTQHPITALVDPRGDNWKLLSVEPREDDEYPDGHMTTAEAKAALGQNGNNRVPAEDTVKWFNKAEDVEKFGTWLADKKDGLPCIGYFEALSGRTISEYADSRSACETYLNTIDEQTDKIGAGNHALYQKIMESGNNPFNAFKHFENWMEKHGWKLDMQPTWQLAHLIENILKVKAQTDAEKPENGGGKDDDGIPPRPTTHPRETAKQAAFDGMPEAANGHNQYDDVTF